MNMYMCIYIYTYPPKGPSKDCSLLQIICVHGGFHVSLWGKVGVLKDFWARAVVGV